MGFGYDHHWSPIGFRHCFRAGIRFGFRWFIIAEMKLGGIVIAAASLLPHNLLLIPALIIASTAALSFAGAAVRTLIGTEHGGIVNQFLATTFIIFMTSLLLAAASLVEMYITPELMQLSRRLIM